MYITPKYVYFDRKVKSQDVEFSCFDDKKKDITSKCKLKLAVDNPDITISNNAIKIGKKPKSSANKIIVLYERTGAVEQDYAMAYIE